MPRRRPRPAGGTGPIAQPGNCPKCAGTTERGFVVDRNHGIFLESWAADAG
ncbi:MAG TPA: hypothetical protein VF782_07420 [Allosphingosinicella sp.]